jgi:hypothetical protein
MKKYWFMDDELPLQRRIISNVVFFICSILFCPFLNIFLAFKFSKTDIKHKRNTHILAGVVSILNIVLMSNFSNGYGIIYFSIMWLLIGVLSFIIAKDSIQVLTRLDNLKVESENKN